MTITTMRSLKRVAVSASLLVATALPMAAEARTYVDIGVAPPPPRVEVVPAPRHGYVWAPGYWDYRGHNHVWVAGRYIPQRHGYRYETARCVAHENHYR